MATTDAKSGFRLPWSSDRAADHETQSDTPDATAAESSDWPSAEGTDSPAAATVADEPAPEAPAAEAAPTPAPAARPSRKPTKFLADLARAMHAAAEEAREQTLSQFQGDAKAFVELIHESSATESTALRSKADEDVAGIREWSKAEIARIREETERRIEARKRELTDELEEHAASIEYRVAKVNAAVTEFESEMDAFFERLLAEEDPTTFAAMAENLPEPPRLEDLVPGAGAASVVTEAAEAAVETGEAQAEPADEVTESVEPEPSAEAEAVAETAAEQAADEEAAEQPEAVVETDEADTAAAEAAEGEMPEAVAEQPEPSGWPTEPADEWPEGTVTHDPVTGEPLDRAAIMAALEAAAEAVVAAESAAESAKDAEQAADVAETAAELLANKVEGDGHDAWPAADFGAAEAEAALAARADAVAGEDSEGASFVERFAGLVPQHDDADADGPVETRTTQVVVVGLVSVASIASFKRHLGRVGGVESVAVSSGPDGEFVFTVTHRSDVVFRDVVPTLPGFGARVTGSSDGVVNVTARDPESES